MSSDVDAIMAEVTRKAADYAGVDAHSIDTTLELTEQGIDSVQLMGIAEVLHAHVDDVDFADLAEDPRLIAWRDIVEDSLDN